MKKLYTFVLLIFFTTSLSASYGQEKSEEKEKKENSFINPVVTTILGSVLLYFGFKKKVKGVNDKKNIPSRPEAISGKEKINNKTIEKSEQPENNTKNKAQDTPQKSLKTQVTAKDDSPIVKSPNSLTKPLSIYQKFIQKNNEKGKPKYDKTWGKKLHDNHKLLNLVWNEIEEKSVNKWRLWITEKNDKIIEILAKWLWKNKIDITTITEKGKPTLLYIEDVLIDGDTRPLLSAYILAQIIHLWITLDGQKRVSSVITKNNNWFLGSLVLTHNTHFQALNKRQGYNQRNTLPSIQVLLTLIHANPMDKPTIKAGEMVPTFDGKTTIIKGGYNKFDGCKLNIIAKKKANNGAKYAWQVYPIYPE